MRKQPPLTGATFLACAASIAACAAFMSAYWAWLPDVSELRSENPKTTKYMELYVRRILQRGGKPMVSMRWTPLEEMSPYLRRAVLVAEDDSFYSHRGVDWPSLKQAMGYNLRRRKLARGASTITQQVARNLFLSPRRSPARKLRELLIARHLDRSLDKDRILELYLNIVEWGEGIFGAEAASLAYFEKHAAELSPEEAVALVAALPSPYRLHPSRSPDPVTLKKIGVYLERMRARGYLPREER